MAHSGKPDETSQEEAELLSAMEGSAMGGGYDVDDDEFDPDLADLNDPDVSTLAEPPMLGGRAHSHGMFGQEASAVGRATSPKLWSSASQFPSASQFRVWRMENGVPVGLGAIAIDANEEDFVRSFFDAMPQPGQGRFQFILRPIDLRGKELGKEIALNISEHHAMLRYLREQKKREEQEGGPNGWGRGGDVIVHGQQGDGGGAYFAEEMGRMFEHSVEMAEAQTRQYQEQLERERAELREQERLRAEERVRAAENASSVTERMTEKLMATDRERSAEALASQKETSQLVMSTLTTTFSQQQEAARLQAERERQLELRRQEQERAFYERREKELEMQRQREREESERRRREEREEHERKLERERLEAERRERERKEELEARREQMRIEMEERRLADERRREEEKRDWERRMAVEREERERREQARREEAERKERLDRERFEREKLEMQQRLEQQRLEWERKREEMRREDERRERLRREAAEKREQQRQEEIKLQQAQMEMAAQRDREHAERMMEMARQEREAQRETQAARERAEREAREAADAEKQRRHELMLREMEIQKERDREHAERMLQLSKMESGGGGGLSGIVEMLGMETPEVLARIFGGSEESEGWSDALPKMLGGIGEVAKVVLANQQQGAGGKPKQGQPTKQGPVRHGRQPAAKDQKMVAIKTPQGIKLISADQFQELQQHQLDQMKREGVQVRQRVRPSPQPMDLPDAPYRPPGMAEGDADEVVPDLGQDNPAHVPTRAAQPTSPAEQKLAAGEDVNTVKRAKDAGMTLAKQKKARRAVRDLIQKLEKSDEDDWLGLVTEAITSNIDIYHYLKAVTVYAALAEVRVEPDFANKIVTALRESGMVPEDALPYDEGDFRRLQAAANSEGADSEESGE